MHLLPKRNSTNVEGHVESRKVYNSTDSMVIYLCVSLCSDQLIRLTSYRVPRWTEKPLVKNRESSSTLFSFILFSSPTVSHFGTAVSERECDDWFTKSLAARTVAGKYFRSKCNFHCIAELKYFCFNFNNNSSRKYALYIIPIARITLLIFIRRIYKNYCLVGNCWRPLYIWVQVCNYLRWTMGYD